MTMCVVAIALGLSACSIGSDEVSTDVTDLGASLEASAGVEDLAMTDPAPTTEATAATTNATEKGTDHAGEKPAAAHADDDASDDDQVAMDDDEATPATKSSIAAVPTELAWLTRAEQSCLKDKLANGDAPDVASTLLTCVSFGRVSQHNAAAQGVRLSAPTVDCLDRTITDAEIAIADLGALIDGDASTESRIDMASTLIGCLTPAEQTLLAQK